MCNYLHDDHEPIAETGKGWKLFSSTDGKTSLVDYVHYQDAPDGFTYWDINLHHVFKPGQPNGFCFFLTKREAKRAAKVWGPKYTTILPIIYEEGLGQHREENFCIGETFTIALCRSFKLAPLPKPRRALFSLHSSN